jgi:acyl-CoA thioesterase
VNYIAKVEPRDEVTVRARRVGEGRSVQHWQSELLSTDNQTLAQATIVFARRGETDGFTEPRMPEAPDPDTLEKFHPRTGAHGERVLQRPIVGYPPFGRKSSLSLSWVRELSGRPVDHLQLAFLSDCYAPRIWFASAGPRMSATMTLSVHFLAGDRELQAVGDNYVFSEVIGTRGADSIVGQQARFWSARGVLLATSEQLCWYR